MRAVILCPGPSLAAITALPPHDVLLAVNRAMDHALAKTAAWWVALDLWGWKLPLHVPTEGMVTSRAAISEGQAEQVPYRLEPFDQHPRAIATATTLPAALWWAVHLGATEAELVGCDLAGTRDFLGSEGSKRDTERWDRERHECIRVWSRTGLKIKGLPGWP